MGCLKGGQIGSAAQTQGATETYRPFQVDLMKKLTERYVTPALATAGPVPGMEFAPGGPSPLQQQAMNLGAALPNYLTNNPAFAGFDPSQINMAMKPVGDYAQSMFQQQTIPSIMSALGETGAARGSGAMDILGREGRNLSLGLASQFAPMQYQGLQDTLSRQAQMPSIAANLTGTIGELGGLQRSFGEALKDYQMQRWEAGQPWTNPALNYLSAALGQPMTAYSQAGRMGYREPAFMETYGGSLFGLGGLAMSDERFKENIKPIDNALDKIKQLDGKTYNFLFNNKPDCGVIAQDLEKILPEAVIEQNNIKYVKYEAVIALLVNAVKELARKVEQ